MLTINGVTYTLSEVISHIKTHPDMVWHKGYPYYLLKIKGSGQTTFATYTNLIMKLAGYVMNEPKDPVGLARYRGNGPTLNSAMLLQPISATALSKVEDRASIAALMATGDIDGTAGVTNRSAHNCDPETGFQKSGSVQVSEFYINGADGRRATKRVDGMKTTYYYSDSHVANTYKYQRLT